MIVRVLVPPEPLITIAEAKAYLRVEHSEDDALISSLVTAASSYLDGPKGWLGRAIGEQKLEALFAAFVGRSVCLPFSPVISVESIKYLDAAVAEQTIDPANYSFSDGSVWLADGFAYPGVQKAWNANRITYTAGFEEVPEALKVAVKMHVGTMYENRASIGEPQSVLPHAYEALCAAYKVWPL